MQTLNPASGPGLLTWSGRFVPAVNGAYPGQDKHSRWSLAPSAIDIAVSLSRVPRFCGHGRIWWSCLDHQLFVERLARHTTTDRHGRLAALGHDDHECLTADLPTHFKSKDMRVMQTALDVRIMDALFPGGYEEYAPYLSLVKVLDQRALLAEAQVVGPSCTDEPGAMQEYFGAEADENDVWYLKQLLRQRPSIDKLMAGRDAPTVVEFLNLIHELR